MILPLKLELKKFNLNIALVWMVWTDVCLVSFLLFYLNECRIFLSLIETAGLTDLLKQEGSFTIFAPTDDAFEGLTREDFDLLKSEYPNDMNPSFRASVFLKRNLDIHYIVKTCWPCVSTDR